MATLDPQRLNEFASARIEEFHNARLDRLQKVRLNNVLRRKNPYLFRAKDMQSAPEMVRSLLDAYLSSSEEELFGRIFLESLAIRVSGEVANGRKSPAEGIDLEFERDTTHFLVSIKSGPNWGNNSQKTRLVENFQLAVKVLQQGDASSHIQPVLGICYGRAKTTNLYILRQVRRPEFLALPVRRPRLVHQPHRTGRLSRPRTQPELPGAARSS